MNRFLLSFLLLFATSGSFAQSKLYYVVFALSDVKCEAGNCKASVVLSQPLGISTDYDGNVYGRYSSKAEARNQKLGSATVTKESPTRYALSIELLGDEPVKEGDWAELACEAPSALDAYVWAPLWRYGISFTNEKDKPFFDREAILLSGKANEEAINDAMLKELQAFAKKKKDSLSQITPQAGVFDGKNMYEALMGLDKRDFRSMLRFAESQAMKFIGNEKRLSEVAGVWVQAGGVFSYPDLGKILIEAPQDFPRYRRYITDEAVGAWADIATALEKEEDYAEGEKWVGLLAKAYQEFGLPENAGYFYALHADWLLKAASPQKALEAANKSVEQLANSKWLFFGRMNRGQAYMALGNADEAWKNFQAGMQDAEATRKNTDVNSSWLKEYSEALRNAAAYSDEKEDYAQSLAYYLANEAALRQMEEPDTKKIYDALFSIALTYNRMERYDEGKTYFRRYMVLGDTAASDDAYWRAGVAYYRIGLNHYSQSNFDSAMAYFGHAALIANALDAKYPNNTGVVETLGNIYEYWGRSHKFKEQYEASLKYFQESQAFFLKAHNLAPDDGYEVSYANMRRQEGIILRNLKRYKEALMLCQELLGHPSNAAGERKGIALWDLALVYADLEQYDASNNLYKQAMAVYEKLDDQEDVRILKNNIARNLKNGGNYQEAIPYFEEKARYYEDLTSKGDRSKETLGSLASAYDDLSTCYRKLKKADDAIAYQQQCLKLYQEAEDTIHIADTYWDLGIIEGDVNKDYAKAIAFYHKSIEIYKHQPQENTFSIATLYGNIAINYGSMNLYDSALRYRIVGCQTWEQSYKAKPSANTRLEWADDLVELALKYAERYAYKEADQYMQQALDWTKEVARVEPENRKAQLQLQEMYDKSSDYELGKGNKMKAVQWQEERLRFNKDREDVVQLADSYFSLAAIHFDDANYELAKINYAKAYDMYLVIADTSNAIYAQSNVAQCEWNLLMHEDAEKTHLKAIDLAEKLQSGRHLGFSWKELARLYQEMGEIQKSKHAVEQAIRGYELMKDPNDLIDAYMESGNVFNSAKQHARARTSYEKALALAQEHLEYKKEGEIFMLIGGSYSSEDRYRTADEYAKKAVAVYEKINDLAGLSNAYSTLGALKATEGNFTQANTYYEKALGYANELQSQNLIAYCKRGIAHLKVNMGKYDEAFQLYNEAIALYQKNKQYSSHSSTLQSIAWLYSQKGDFDKSMAYYQDALGIAERAKDKNGVANCKNAISDLHRIWGDYAKAMQMLDEASKLYEETSNPWGKAGIFLSRGNVQNTKGSYQEAIADYEKADSIYHWLENAQSRATPLNNIGTIYYWQGDYERALSYFKESLRLLDSLGIKESFYSMVQGNMGEIYSVQGKYKEAEQILTESLKRAEELGDKGMIATDCMILGRTKMEQRQYELALQYMQKAYDMSKDLKAKSFHTDITQGLGKLYYLMRQPDKAKQYLGESVEVAKSIGVNKRLWDALYYKGLIAKEAGNLDEAKALLMESVHVLEDIQNKVVGGEDAQKLFAAGAEKIKVYDALVEVLIAKGEVELGMQYLERSNNQELKNQLKQQEIQFKDQQKQEAIKKERAMKAEVDQANKLLAQEKSKEGAEGRVKQLEAVKSVAEQKYLKYVNDLYVQQPDLRMHLSVDPTALKTEKNQRFIPKDLAMISYLPGDNQLHIFLATSDTVIAKVVEISREELSKRITFINNFCSHQMEGVQTGALKPFRGSPVSEVTPNLEDADFHKVSEELYGYLVAPVAKEIGNKPLVGIIPSGVLHFLPFQLLGWRSDAGRFNYLIEEYPIFYANSLRMLRNMQEGKPAFKVMALGNADGSLPATEKEVGQIRDIFPTSVVYVREDASEGKVKEQYQQFNIIHFATHGTLDPYSMYDSYLTLAGTGGDDGKLTIEEIFEFGLYNCQLVTLSACQTAVSASGKDQWPISPAAGFLQAGANAVIGSLWKVDDEATGKLMGYFYENLKTMSKAEALRTAQVQLSQDPKFHHPYYWAPFILLGDWR